MGAGLAFRVVATKSPVPKAAEPGNTRAVKSGVRSERKLAPVREGHARDLRTMYPDLHGVRLAFLADLFAKIDLGNAWLDQQGGVVRDKKGEIFTVAKEVEKWQMRADRIIRELEAQRRTAAPATDLATQMAELAAAEENGG